MLAFQEVEELESKVIILCYSKWESSLNYTYFSPSPSSAVGWTQHLVQILHCCVSSPALVFQVFLSQAGLQLLSSYLAS